MQKIKIERRLPFGFMGDWGKLFKRYSGESGEIKTEDTTEIAPNTDAYKIDTSAIKYSKNFYVDLGMDVQFRESTDESSGTETPNTGMAVDTAYMTVKTTDAYFNDARRQYECIVSSDDLVIVFGRLWIVQGVREKIVRRTPLPMKVFYCELKSIL